MQDGDVLRTFADITKSNKELGFSPKYSINSGLIKFVAWYQSIHN